MIYIIAVDFCRMLEPFFNQKLFNIFQKKKNIYEYTF